MTKEEILEAIKQNEDEQSRLRAERRELISGLSNTAKWRAGDVIETPDGVFKLTFVYVVPNTGSVSFGSKGVKQTQSGRWSKAEQYIYADRDKWTLLERPSGNPATTETISDDDKSGE